ncbi:MAG: hypothetical protein WAM42_12440 [Candidatus Nitrosopolaris sp.]|jgi:hypothetical protein
MFVAAILVTSSISTKVSSANQEATAQIAGVVRNHAIQYYDKALDSPETCYW